jgi:beta-lactamase class A
MLNADEPFPPASTLKVAVMAEAFHQAEQGLLALDDRVRVGNAFTSAADGQPYSLRGEDDADPRLYDRIGQLESLCELIRRMIVRSSNLATNVLIEKIGLGRINALLCDSGIEGMAVRRGIFDIRAQQAGISNSTTARGLTRLMSLLAEGRLVSRPASDGMIQIMLGQEFKEGIPAGLPGTVRVAHKTGWDDQIYHDCGIVFPEAGTPYALTVLTRGFREPAEGHAFAAAVSQQIYSRWGRPIDDKLSVATG